MDPRLHTGGNGQHSTLAHTYICDGRETKDENGTSHANVGECIRGRSIVMLHTKASSRKHYPPRALQGPGVTLPYTFKNLLLLPQHLVTFWCRERPIRRRPSVHLERDLLGKLLTRTHRFVHDQPTQPSVFRAQVFHCFFQIRHAVEQLLVGLFHGLFSLLFLHAEPRCGSRTPHQACH